MMMFGTKAVVAFKLRGQAIGGYHVVVSVTDSSDGMYQELVHPAVFKTAEEAEHLLDRMVRSRMKLNIRHWIVGNHPCDAWQRDPANNPLMYCPLKK